MSGEKGNASFHVKINCGNQLWGKELADLIYNAYSKKGTMILLEGDCTWEIWGKIKEQENNNNKEDGI